MIDEALNQCRDISDSLCWSDVRTQDQREERQGQVERQKQMMKHSGQSKSVFC